MNITVTKHGRLILAVTAVYLLLFAVNAHAVIDGVSGSVFNFTAKADYISIADGGSVPIWGYADGSGRAQYPGPTLILQEDVQVTIHLKNELPASAGNVSIVLPGQEGVTASGGVSGLLTQEAPPDDGTTTVTYVFTPTEPGTYTYYSGTRPELQIEMGLVGAIIVRPADFDPDTNITAYGHPDSAYDHEYLFLLSEMDPEIHQQAGSGMVGSIDNTAWWPVYWFINGRAAPDTMLPAKDALLPTQPYNCLPRMLPGERLLLRVINAGRDLHPFHTHGNHVRIIAKDGRLLSSGPGAGPNLATSEFTIQSVPGETVDAIFEWTGQGLGWDIYGHVAGDGSSCTPDGDGLDPVTREWCADHLKPVPVALPDRLDLTFGGFYSGSPFLGGTGTLPPGEGGFNLNGGLFYMWHSHAEKELVNFDIFPGGMMTMMIIEPPGTPIP